MAGGGWRVAGGRWQVAGGGWWWWVVSRQLRRGPAHLNRDRDHDPKRDYRYDHNPTGKLAPDPPLRLQQYLEVDVCACLEHLLDVVVEDTRLDHTNSGAHRLPHHVLRLGVG